VRQVLLVKLDAPASPLYKPSISDRSPLKSAMEVVLTNELDNALPTHLIRKVQIGPKLEHLTKDKHSIDDLFLPFLFIVFIVLYAWNSGETTGAFLDPVEASIEEELDLEGEKGENGEAVREVESASGAGGE
jgi:hypothetical protein